MFKTLRKVWKYIKKYKALLFITILLMLIVQVLNLFSPIIVKSIIDDNLVAIEKPWYLSSDFQGVEFNNKFYNQDIKTESGAMIIIHRANYYFVDRIILEDFVKGNKQVKNIGDNNYKITLTKQNGDILEVEGIKLKNTEVRLFYEPVVNPLKILVLLLALRLFFAILFQYLQRVTTSTININIVRDARIDAVNSLQKLPMSYFENEPAGKIANRIIYDVGGMMGLFSTIMNLLLNASMSIVFAYVGMFYLDKELALWTFILFPLVYFWIKLFIRNLNKIAEKVNEQGSLITAQLNEIINGIAILQIFNYEEETTKKFNTLTKSYMNEQLKENRLHLGLGWNLIRLLGALITAAIVLYFGNGYLNISGFVVTAGTIYAYNTYLTGIIEPVGTLFREIGNLQHSLVRTERIFKLIEGPQEDDTNYEIEKYKGKITFDDVWFSYVKGHPILKGISFEILPNTMVGIVGSTGSGKSTLMNLLLRFYDLEDKDSGNIYIDDININTHPKRSFRNNIGIILQDPVLFNGSIYDNVNFGSNRTEEEVYKIINSVGGGHLLEKFPNGILEHVNSKGSNLSIGEKQILSFARVIAHDPKILIMDEATANIDTETEEMIQKALDKVKENRTVIIIAHRLSTIKKADKILVLENGLKIEEGTHDQLIYQNGVYANIYRSQVKENI